MQPSRVPRPFPACLIALTALPDQAAAHASEGGLVLLLPTGIYTAAGVAAVAATVLLLAVLLAHGLAVLLLRDRRRALQSQVPLAAFMIAYTLFGLWLLASPRF